MKVLTSDGYNHLMDRFRHPYKNAVIIGDSLSKGFYNGTEHAGEGAGEQTCKALGITNYQNVAVSGSGYGVGGSNTFPNQWNRVTNKSDVDLVLVIGGVNDTNGTNVLNGLTTLLDSIADTAPKARTFVFPVAGGRGLKIDGNLQWVLETLIKYPYYQSRNKRVNIIQGVHRWGTSLEDSDCDGYIHLFKSGYEKWGKIAAHVIANNADSYWPFYMEELIPVTYGGDPLFSEVQQAHIWECNGITHFSIRANLQRQVDDGKYVFQFTSLQGYGGNHWFSANKSGKEIQLVFDDGGVKATFGDLTTGWLIASGSWVSGTI